MENVDIVLIADNIRSLENIGSLFRTADAVGVKEILCVGISGYPDMGEQDTRRPYLRLKQHKALSKTALSGISTPFRYFATVEDCLDYVRSHKYHLLVVEQDPRSCDVRTIHNLSKKYAVVLGNEVTGVSQAFLDSADTIVELPMRGNGTSLNVAVCAGIILFSIVYW